MAAVDTRQLRQFIAIAEASSFRRAAERLHVSQPPLSMAVRRLEAEVGATLLDRSRHHVRLTAAGEAFLSETREVLKHAELSIDLARRAAAGKLGTLRVAFVPSALFSVVPRLLRAFRTACPDVRMLLDGDTTLQQTQALVSGAADVGIVVPPLHGEPAFRVEPLCRQELALAVPDGHRLATAKRVQLRDIADETFVGLASREGPGFESVVMSACRDAGFVPAFAEQAPQMQTLLALVAAGLGIALVPAAMRLASVDGVAYVQVRQGRAALSYPLALAFRHDNDNPALLAFVATARRVDWR